MSTGRRRPDSDGSSKSASRGRKKAVKGNGSLLNGAIIIGGVGAFASLFFLFPGSDNSDLPAVSQAAPSITSTAPAAVPTTPIAVAVPASSVAGGKTAQAGTPVATASTAPVPPPKPGNGKRRRPMKPAPPKPMGGPGSAVVANAVSETPGTPAPTGKEFTLPELIEHIDPGVVRLACKKAGGGGTGSGFLIDDKGTVVTNYHVICGSRSVEAEFENGDKAAVEGFYVIDDKRDIAIIKIAKPAAVHRPMRLSTELPKKGISVVAFGCPQGLSFSTTQGIVSGIRKPEFVEEQLGTKSGTMIQTDTPISQGNSGGPLVNMMGEVVAMNTLVMTIGQNLNFSVSSLDIADVLKKKGNAVKPITPESVPSRDGFRDFVAKFDDLSATERGRLLLGQVDEVSLMVWPFPLDPTDRINSFCMNHLSKAVEDKLKLNVSTRRQTSTFSPLVMCAFAWTLPKDFVRNGDLASNLELHVMVITRDVDKEGDEVIALVYKDTSVVGTLSVGALADGRITKAMETNVPKFFDKFVSTVRKAKREFQTGSPK